MFQPKYVVTPQLLDNIKRVAVLIAGLNHKRFSSLTIYTFAKAARELSAHSSTSIEGNPLPLTDVKRILKNHPAHLRDTEKEVLNYNYALEILNKGLDQGSLNFNLTLLLKIQKTVTHDLIDKTNAGKLRSQTVFVNDPKVRQPVYLPPDHQDVLRLMEELIIYIQSQQDKIDPLILAGIFHKQFVIIHPFIDGNGRTARLATKALLAGMGLNTFNLFSFENFYNQNVTKYFERVGVRGNYYELYGDIDFTAWLEYFTDGIIDELLRVSTLLDKDLASPSTSLRPYHQNMLDYIGEKGFITDRDYASLTDRAKPTRNQDFNKLIQLGLIVRLGRGKSTYYKLLE